jgi:hypothetical protein
VDARSSERARPRRKTPRRALRARLEFSGWRRTACSAVVSRLYAFATLEETLVSGMAVDDLRSERKGFTVLQCALRVIAISRHAAASRSLIRRSHCSHALFEPPWNAGKPRPRSYAIRRCNRHREMRSDGGSGRRAALPREVSKQGRERDVSSRPRLRGERRSRVPTSRHSNFTRVRPARLSNDDDRVHQADCRSSNRTSARTDVASSTTQAGFGQHSSRPPISD